jgi:hypothetical protein
MMPVSLSRREVIHYSKIFDFVDGIFGDAMHPKRVLSLANATLGTMRAESLAIHLIGQGLAQAKDLDRKHCIKQVDRLLSNCKLEVWDLFDDWVPYLVGDKKEIVAALDWTEFDADGHSTLMLSQITSHGRGTPLIWTTVSKADLKDRRNFHEDAVLKKLKDTLPSGVRATILADRGFCDSNLYVSLQEDLGFDYVIRFRENIHVTNEKGETKAGFEWIPNNGRLRTLKNATVTGKKTPVPVVVFLQRQEMKEAWCLVSSRSDLSSEALVTWYGKRWGIESSFKDIKDYKCGMGMKKIHTASTQRRDRLFLISALAIALLTLLGAAGDAMGLERYIKANTVKTRTYSFFRQGCIYYDLMLGMKTERLRLLMRKFSELLSEQPLFRKVLGII